jgi:hypothetical protein
LFDEDGVRKRCSKKHIKPRTCDIVQLSEVNLKATESDTIVEHNHFMSSTPNDEQDFEADNASTEEHGKDTEKPGMDTSKPVDDEHVQETKDSRGSTAIEEHGMDIVEDGHVHETDNFSGTAAMEQHGMETETVDMDSSKRVDGEHVQEAEESRGSTAVEEHGIDIVEDGHIHETDNSNELTVKEQHGMVTETVFMNPSKRVDERHVQEAKDSKRSTVIDECCLEMEKPDMDPPKRDDATGSAKLEECNLQYSETVFDHLKTEQLLISVTETMTEVNLEDLLVDLIEPCNTHIHSSTGSVSSLSSEDNAELPTNTSLSDNHLWEVQSRENTPSSLAGENNSEHPMSSIASANPSDESRESRSTFKGSHDNEYDSAQPSVTVLTANNHGGIRKWDKQNYCIYCMKPFSKLALHFEQKHFTETAIKQAFSLPKKSTERKLLLMKLTNDGDYAHNTEVLKNGKGVIVPYRRPAEEVDYKEYLPCDYCHGFFKRCRLWEHRRNCPLKGPTKQFGQHRIQSQCAMLLPCVQNVSLYMKENILQKMQHDEISLAAKNDALIVGYGAKAFEKTGHDIHTHGHISQKMRQLCRAFAESARIKSGGHVYDRSRGSTEI